MMNKISPLIILGSILVLVLAFMFRREALENSCVLFSNDGPYGSMLSEQITSTIQSKDAKDFLIKCIIVEGYGGGSFMLIWWGFRENRTRREIDEDELDHRKIMQGLKSSRGKGYQ